jgi:hypothetical protein
MDQPVKRGMPQNPPDRADLVAACIVGLMCVAIFIGVRYAFSRPVAPMAMIETGERPHLP